MDKVKCLLDKLKQPILWVEYAFTKLPTESITHREFQQNRFLDLYFYRGGICLLVYQALTLYFSEVNIYD